MCELDLGRGALTRRDLLLTIAGLRPVLETVPPWPSGLVINPRSTWATNRPPKGPLEPEEVRFLIVHHSASHNGHTSAEAPSIIRSFFDYHTGPEKGWSDIAYNFLIDSEGGVWEGRAGSLDGPVAGDATGGNQGFTQLVCIIGDYNLVEPSDASLRSLARVLAWLADRYHVATEPGSEVTFSSRGSNRWPSGVLVTTPTITGHRTMSRTTCPGDHLNDYVVGELMADVSAIRVEAAATTSVSSSTSSTSTTGPPTTIESLRPPSLSTTEAVSEPADAHPSPVLTLSAVLAGLATAALVWRLRRMAGRRP